jgi:pyruvate kinase
MPVERTYALCYTGAMPLRRAKIVCTIGPASASKKVLFGLIRGGMDVARLNFSHGDHEFHGRAIGLIREGARKYRRPVAILQDLQGIKIRTGKVEGGAVPLVKGQELLVSPGTGIGTREKIYISYPGLSRYAKKGDRILLDDGLMELRVTGKRKGSLVTKVREGGVLRDRKGVNLPGIRISMRSFTEKDVSDLEFGIAKGVDCVAVSFVREASDIRVVRQWLNERGHALPIIAKIEKPEALENIDRIIAEADGLMVARGDLGVEVPPEEVPLLQKMLIEKTNIKGKTVITATQMLESMTLHRRPTRAEVTDVANAVIDGTDALMLSAETSAGKYPLESLAMMDRIIRRTEAERQAMSSYVQGRSFSEAVAEAAARAAEDIGARYIVAFTQSGFTAKLLSKCRPSVPIVAFTPSEEVLRRMSLYWGVIPGFMRPLKSTDEVFQEVETVLLKEKMARKGDSVVITASTPILGAGKTNLIKLHRIGGASPTDPAA